jgi:cell division protein FtsI (penicillin-binding protein 3)
MGPDRRLRLVAWALAGLWLLLLCRAAVVQLVQHAYWEEKALLTQSRRELISAHRGEIRTSDGGVLARSVANWSLAVDPTMVKNPDGLAAALDSLGLMKPEDFRARLRERSTSRFAWVNRDILPETTVDALRRRFPALVVRTEDKRLYPMGRAGGSIAGIVGRDQALGGLETVYDSVLRGRDGEQVLMSDATAPDFQGFERTVVRDPESGADIETTIHARIQEIVLGRLEAGVAREGAAGGLCIVTRPSTGEILAMVQVPSADPADPQTWNKATLRVRPATDSFEPGSSFKLVAFAAATEAGVLDPEDAINCMGGQRACPGGKPIKDHERYGVLKAWEVLAHSSNIGSGVIAERAGAERFYRMEKALGFGEATGIPLPGEGTGRIAEPATWSARSLITMAFGQEVSVTATQMAMAYGAVANGGNLMRPLLVRTVRNADGSPREVIQAELVRPVLRKEVARELRTLFRRVVTDGTGKKAEIERLRPAGKTSTAQKFIREEGAYSSRRYVASFVGFAPYDEPQVLCLVLLDEPTSSIYGGNVAAPLFREIVSDIWPFIAGEEMPSDERSTVFKQTEPDSRCPVPSVEGLAPALAGRIVREAGFRPRLLGAGERVLRSEPASGEMLLPESVVTLRVGSAGDSGFVASAMPDVRGRSLRDALLRVRSAGGGVQADGCGWVLSQFPDPGAPLEPGARCLLTLGPDSSRAYTEFLDSERRTSWAVAVGNSAPPSPQ